MQLMGVMLKNMVHACTESHASGRGKHCVVTDDSANPDAMCDVVHFLDRISGGFWSQVSHR